MFQKAEEARSGYARGGFVLITGLDGIRYVVQPQSVGIIRDADECRDETPVQLHGGHVRCGYPARSSRCWRGSRRERPRCFCYVRHAAHWQAEQAAAES
jgi:hypothetical protein